jgi:hypothetical protein
VIETGHVRWKENIARVGDPKIPIILGRCPVLVTWAAQGMFTYCFVYGLFSDSVSSSDYVESNTFLIND